MNLYFINPNDYGDEYFVMAESKEMIFYYLKCYLKKKLEDEEEQFRSIYEEDYSKWENATIEHLPKKYTIDEYGIGQIVETYNG